MKIKGKEYALVKDRVHAFRERYSIDKEWSLVGDVIVDDGKRIMYRASIISPSGTVGAMRTAEEVRGSSNINRTSALENCESSAWGRCLANAGFSTDGNIASAEEVERAIEAQENWYKTLLDENYGLTEGQMHRWCMTNGLGAWDELKNDVKDRIVADLKDGTLLIEDVRNPKPMGDRVVEKVKQRKEDRKNGLLSTDNHDGAFQPAKFAAQLKEVGWKLEEISAFCELVGHGRPSSWSERNRERFVQRLKSGKLDRMPPAVCKAQPKTKEKAK